MDLKKPILPVLLLAAVLFSAALLVNSCSGGSGNAVTSKVVKTYGADGMESILSFTGRGYLKVLPIGDKVINLPLDIYQDRSRYCVSYVEVDRGEVAARWIWLHDGSKEKAFSTTGKWVNRPEIEYRYLDYRFPMLVQWMSRYEGEVGADITSEGYILNYEMPDLSVEVTVGKRSGYILRTAISDKKNNIEYSEDYTDYREVDGTPFPNRITAAVNGVPYCEFFIPAIDYGAAPPDSAFSISRSDTAM